MYRMQVYNGLIARASTGRSFSLPKNKTGVNHIGGINLEYLDYSPII